MVANGKRIYELAKEYKVSSHAMLKIVQDLGFDPKSHMSVAEPEMITAVSLKFAQEKQVARRAMQAKQKAVKEKEAREKAEREKVAKEKAARAAEARELEAQKKAKAEAAKAPNPVSPPASPTRPTATPAARPPQTPGRPAPGRGPGAPALPHRRRKGGRKKKERRDVDRVEVAKSFRATMANLSGKKIKRKYKRTADDGTPVDAENGNYITVNEFMSVAELAKIMDRKSAEVVAKLLELGMMATINQRLDLDTIEMVAGEFEFDVRVRAEVGEEVREIEVGENLESRAPIVTVMGHVDHGKTSLLDYIRKTNVVGGEAGAITQHIGAYEVAHLESKIVFLDTPGHEAFTAMRARGSQITDIIVLIVAADEGTRPQTIEAIDHARAAGAPIIVAISKIDKPNANAENVRTQLANHNLLSEDWGGKTIFVEISSKTGEGIDKLIEMIVLQAEMMDLKADPQIRAQGVIVESKLEKGRGPVATVLIQRGMCKVGDPIVAGTHSGRIRTIVNDRTKSLKEIGPSTPAQITGLSGVPQAGDSFMKVRDDQEARDIVLQRDIIKREYDARRPRGAITLERVFDQIQEGQIKEVRLVIKGDVDGSVEVLCDTLGKIATDEVKTNIIRSGVGAITESDVLLAAASGAVIIGFHVSPESRARELARQEKVDIRQYDIIYEAEDDVRKALEGLLAPTLSEKFTGMAEVRDTFKVPKIGLIAGCHVKEGRINRKDKVKLTRDGVIVFTGTIGSLRRFKDDTREVREGFECGIGLEGFNDVKVGDLIEAYEIVETARTLNA